MKGEGDSQGEPKYILPRASQDRAYLSSDFWLADEDPEEIIARDEATLLVQAGHALPGSAAFSSAGSGRKQSLKEGLTQPDPQQGWRHEANHWEVSTACLHNSYASGALV